MSKTTPTLRTRVGHSEWGDNRFRGYSVAQQLVGRETATGMLVLAIAGKRIDQNGCAMLDDLATVMAVADPRIWPLKLVRVTSAYGGCLAAVAAATITLEGALVGHASTGRAAAVLVDLRERLLTNAAPGENASDLAIETECRHLLAAGTRTVGFGVPFRQRDERVDMLAARVAARGRADLPYWQLFVRVTATFRRIRRLEANIGLAAAAVCLDMGFSLGHIGPLVTALGASDLWCNAVEGSEQMPPSLQTLPTDCVRYVGPPSRVSPRASRGRPEND